MIQEKAKISVVTAFYHGNQYMEDYWDCLGAASAAADCPIEVVLINDSPEVSVCLSEKPMKNLKVRVIEHSKNCGIHQSRIHGIEEAEGAYLLILDQDDRISENYFKSQMEKIGDADVIVANGYDEYASRKGLLYQNHFSGMLALDEKMHLKVRNLIISPGQCLIRKEAVPAAWKKYVLKENGVDDAFLWFLMFDQNKKFVYNEEVLFTHCYTGTNISSTVEKMLHPHEELVACMLQMEGYPKKKARIYAKTVPYKFAIKGGKAALFRESIKHPDLFLTNLFYKLIFRGITANRENLQ